MNRLRLVAFTLILIISTVLASSSIAAEKATCEPISKARVASVVTQVTAGKILSIVFVSRGQPIYRVKVLLASGRVKSIVVDACTGQIIN